MVAGNTLSTTVMLCLVLYMLAQDRILGLATFLAVAALFLEQRRRTVRKVSAAMDTSITPGFNVKQLNVPVRDLVPGEVHPSRQDSEIEDYSFEPLEEASTNRYKKMNKEAVYLENVYDKNSFSIISDYCQKIKDSDMVIDPKNVRGRGMYVFKNDDQILKTICNKTLIQAVRKLTGNNKLSPCFDIPIEYRKYFIGSYMDWHRDTPMLEDQLQYECIITIINTGDSKTLFEYEKGIKQLQTVPNSILIVRANGIKHKVTKLTKGTRTIIKLVFSE
jgi:hypothetical protein